MKSQQDSMLYRLDELALLATESGLVSERISRDRLDVILFEECRLSFCNLTAEDDTLVGFDGTPWHSHGGVSFLAGSLHYVECDELDILIGLCAGELVVVSQFVDGVIRDRWIGHKKEPLDLEHLRTGEELRARRLPSAGKG
jgi:hypothetical protein